MNKTLMLLLLLSCFSRCKKEHTAWITGTVTAQQGCYPNSRTVQVDEPNDKKHTFLCDGSIAILSSSTINCGNAVVILDVPSSLRAAGTRVKFSRWKLNGPSCYSSTMAPNHIEAVDIRPL